MEYWATAIIILESIDFQDVDWENIDWETWCEKVEEATEIAEDRISEYLGFEFSFEDTWDIVEDIPVVDKI